MTKKIYYDFLKLKKVKGALSSLRLDQLKSLAMKNGFMSQGDDNQIDLSGKVKSLKLGNLIINIHNNLGGSPEHPYINKVAKIADVLPETHKKEIEKSLQPHIEKAKKFSPVITTKPISKIDPNVISSSF